MAAQKLCPTCGERYAADILFCPRDGAPLATRPADAATDPYLGTSVGGVRLEQLVGIGSMARVYRSYQAGVERDVAVKVLRQDLMTDRAIVARFWREAKVAGRLAHPGVISVISTGVMPAGEPCIVMEFLDGLTLRSLLVASSEPLPMARAIHIVLQAADALGEAHAAGVIHRDLKPENVMLVRRGDDPDFVKVLDFGVAHATWVADDAATRAGSVLGTADYLSPEAGRGQPASPRSDVYSLASILFECLTGRRTHLGTGPVDVLVQKATRDAPDARELTQGRVPEPLAAWLRKNLSRTPAERDADARQAGRSLAEAALRAGFSGSELGLGATLLGSGPSGSTRALTLTAEMRARMGDAAPFGRGGVPGATSIALLVGALSFASVAHAAEEAFYYPEPEHDDTGQTYGMAEVGVGLLTLPTAEVCIQRAEAGCTKGDRSLLLSAWPIFRRDQLAVGAGVGFGLGPSADAPPSQEVEVARDHTRSYFTVEMTGRYYLPFNENLDGWLGVTGGLVVVNDTFTPTENLTEQALVGPRGVTLLTEGGTLGLAGGMTYMMTPSFLIGGHVGGAMWFFPEEPRTNALGDEASLRGSVLAIELSATLAYRSRLIF